MNLKFKINSQQYLRQISKFYIFVLLISGSQESFASLAQNNSNSIIGPFFNLDDQTSYTDPYRGIQRKGSNLEQLIIENIESAQFKIDIAVQELRLPLVAKALQKQKQAGIKIRFILENQYNFSISELSQFQISNDRGYSGERIQEYFRFVDMDGNGVLSDYEISQRDAIAIIRNSGIAIIDDTADGSKGSPLMHHKFLIVDNKSVLITSANFTMSDVHGDYSSRVSRGNANSLMIFKDASIIKSYQNEFNLMWGSSNFSSYSPLFGIHKPYRGRQVSQLNNKTNVSIQFSPTSLKLGFEASTNGLIEDTLKLAKRSVNLALFVFSEQRLSNTLNQIRSQYSISIKALVERTFAHQWYSEILDMLGLRLFGHNCNQQPNNQPWSQPITSAGVSLLPEGDFLHHKFGVVDSRYTIIGSQNWSAAANNSNDENLMVIDNPDIARRYEEEFQRLYRNSRTGVTSALKARIKEREKACL